jgi:hypothetical protein
MTKSQQVKDDPFARERRLRRLATKQGFTLVRPWAGERRKIGEFRLRLCPSAPP